MANSEATIATVSSQEEQIGSLLQTPPHGINLPADVIDGIVNDEELVGCLLHMEDGKYLDHFLSSMDWWLKVARLLLDLNYKTQLLNELHREEYSSLAGLPQFTEFNLVDKLGPLMKLYAAAFVAPNLVNAIGRDPSGLVLVKRYQELKVFIGTYANAVWWDGRWEKVIAEA